MIVQGCDGQVYFPAKLKMDVAFGHEGSGHFVRADDVQLLLDTMHYRERETAWFLGCWR